MSKKIKDENDKTYVMKKPFYKRVWFWIVAVIVVFLAIGMFGGGSEEEPKAKDEATSESSSTSSSKKEETKVFKVGQMIEYNGIDMKVEEVKYINPESQEYSGIGKDEQFIAAKVMIKNSSNDEATDYNSYDFKLNADGNVTEWDEIGLDDDNITNNTLDSGSLNKGAKVSGWLVGKVKKNAKKVQLQYTGNLFDDESKIDVNLK